MAIEQPKSDLLMKPRDVANQLRISESTLWRWCREGKFVEPFRFGGTTRFDQAKVQKWIGDREGSKR